MNSEAPLSEVLERIDEVAHRQERVSIRAIMNAVGSRSFGPLVLVAGIVLASPLSGIPGLPTIIAAFVLLVAVQLLLRRDFFWLPGWILNRSISSGRLQNSIKGLRRPARLMDKPLRPRLTFLTYEGGARTAAGACVMIALILPPLEIVPLSSSVGGVALAAFGLSLVANDGVLALLAYTLVFSGLLLLAVVMH